MSFLNRFYCRDKNVSIFSPAYKVRMRSRIILTSLNCEWSTEQTVITEIH